MIRRYLSALALALFAVTGCSDQSVNPVSPESAGAPQASLIASDIDLQGVLEFAELPDLSTSRHAEKFIAAAEGGSVELHGFRVDIPAGALPHNALITIDLPSDAVLGKRVLAEFGPHGIQFNKPVTISFPLDGVVLTGSPIEVARWENNAWTSLGGWVSVDGSRLSSTTPRFSTYSGHVMAGG